MSFAFDIKYEISGNHSLTARHCKISMLAGILLCGNIVYDRDELKLTTENKYVAITCYQLFDMLLDLATDDMQLMNTKHNCRVQVTGKKAMDNVFELFKIELSEEVDKHIFPITSINLNQACCKRAFIMGCFLGAGSLNDPDKSYHFEIVTKKEEIALMLCDVFKDFDVKIKVIRRKDAYVVYSKDSESVSSVLLVMNAANSLMRFENTRIEKQVRNQINRGINFEVSNLKKAGMAGDRQLDDIKLVLSKMGMASLDANLQEVVKLRMDNPESSLKELSELSGTLSKSCINHRLRKIRELAQRLS